MIRKATGLLPTLLAMATLLALEQTRLRVLWPGTILLLVVAWTAFRSGTAVGLISAAFTLAYTAWFASIPGKLFHFETSDAIRVAVTGFCAPAMALLVGELRHRAEITAQRANELAAELARQEGFDALRESEARLRAIVDGTSDGIFIKDLTGRYILVNAAGAANGNRAIDRIVGARDVDLLAPEVAAAVAEQDRKVIETGHPQNYEQTVATPAGPRTYLVSKGLYTDPDGKALGIFGISKDITERKQIEQEMRRLMEEAMAGRARFEAILAQMPAGVAIAEAPSGRLVLVNPQLARIWRRAAVDPKDIREYADYEAYGADGRRFGPEDWPLARAIRRGEVTTAEEIRIIRGDGSEGWVTINAGPVRDEAGNIVAAVAAALDVTERKATEEAARQQQAELAHLARVATMGEITSGLAHELTQPLGAILNYAGVCGDLLEPGEPAPFAVADAIHEIEREAKRAGEIIRRVRGFVRRQAPHVAATDLNHVVREAVAMMAADLRAAGVRVQSELSCDPPPIVLADPVQIEQVLVNLIRNALDAMIALGPAAGARRELLLTTASDGRQRARVSVRDSGCGLDEQQKGRLFEAFYTTKPHGLGIGLSLSRSIVEAHGGSISVEPNGGDGAGEPGITVHFTLPLEKGHVVHEREATVAQST